MSLDEYSGPKISAVFILEIVGHPKEHLTETLKSLIEDMEKEKGIEVTGKDIKEPHEIDGQKDFFTTFAEVEIRVEEPIQLALMMFKYMPSNVEVMEPETLKLSNHNMSEILSELTRRLHGYDEMTRVLQLEKQESDKKIQELEEKLKPVTEITQEKVKESKK